MPVVIVYGKGVSFQLLNRDIVAAIESIPEMELKGKDQVKIIYPEFESNTDKTVVVEVRILDLPQRTEKVRDCLMAAVSRAIEKHCPKKNVLCTISLLQEKQGFCFLGVT